MRRERLPCSLVLSLKRVLGGALESQGGGPERRVRVLFRMFFSVAKQITVEVATQRAVNAPLPTAIHGWMGAQDGVLSRVLERRCDVHNSRAIKHEEEGEGGGGRARIPVVINLQLV